MEVSKDKTMARPPLHITILAAGESCAWISGLAFVAAIRLELGGIIVDAPVWLSMLLAVALIMLGVHRYLNAKSLIAGPLAGTTGRSRALLILLMIVLGPGFWVWLAMVFAQQTAVLTGFYVSLVMAYLLLCVWTFMNAGIHPRRSRATVVTLLVLVMLAFAAVYLAKVVEWQPLANFLMRVWPGLYQ